MPDIPPAAGTTLWPRVWPWFSLLHAYGPLVALTGPQDEHSETQFLEEFINFISWFHEDVPTRTLILRTPGLPTIVARCAHLLLAVPGSSDRRVLVDYIPRFFFEFKVKDHPNALAELIDAAGGSIDDLAELVVQLFDVLPKHENFFTNWLEFTYRMINFIAAAEGSNIQTPDWRQLPLGALFEALARHGLVAAVIRVSHRIATASEAHDPRDSDYVHASIHFCFAVVQRLLIYTADGITFDSAFEAGILPLILKCALLKDAATLHHFHRALLEFVFPLAFCHQGTMARMVILQPFPEESQDAFKHCAIYPRWTRFIERARKLSLLAQACSTSSRACDACNIILSRKLLSQCSGCEAVHYCTKACQKRDWQHGGHRALCESFSQSRLTLSATINRLFPFKQRTYMRVLLDHEYQSNLHSICTAQIAFLSQHPFNNLLLTVFTVGHNAHFTVYSATASEIAARYRNLGVKEWDNLVGRATRSAGKMQLHILQTCRRGSDWVVVLPLRTKDSILFRGIQRIAGKISNKSPEEKEAETEQDVRALLSGIDDGETIGIH
ncbi:hypothetical protein C8F01DRAFT_1090285 [Mycena amicta]|nr:hypothetical protein C8F01DRAFT_1090285 [Mycena amicta]